MNDQPPSPCPIADAVSKQVITRSAAGWKKYGCNLTTNTVSHLGWLQHLQEELLDGANYIERLKRDEEERAKDTARLNWLMAMFKQETGEIFTRTDIDSEMEERPMSAHAANVLEGIEPIDYQI